MAKKSILVNATKGFNLVNEDGTERRYEAHQPYPLTEFSDEEIISLKENGVELYRYFTKDEAEKECQ
jgi:hypothetical protein